MEIYVHITVCEKDEGGYSVLEPEGIQSTKSPKDSLHKCSLQHTNQLFINLAAP